MGVESGEGREHNGLVKNITKGGEAKKSNTMVQKEGRAAVLHCT